MSFQVRGDRGLIQNEEEFELGKERETELCSCGVWVEEANRKERATNATKLTRTTPSPLPSISLPDAHSEKKTKRSSSRRRRTNLNSNEKEKKKNPLAKKKG